MRTRGPKDGVTLVEFALVAPVFFVAVMGLVILGIVGMNQIGLTNAVRDAARAAAVCGSGSSSVASLPDGSSCGDANLVTYIRNLIKRIPSGAEVGSPTVTVYVPALGGGYTAESNSALTFCLQGYRVEVSAQYSQPLFVPLIGLLLGNNGSTSTRTLSADAEATCEQ